MSKGIVTRFTCTFSLLLLIFIEGYSQDVSASTVRLMFYNVENLFDTSNDTLKDDDEFLPGGVRRWNSKRYYSKINSIFKTIVAAGEWSPPVIIGLCEVENREVLEDLIYGTNLSRFNYGIIHEDSPDPRGIDVCMIYLKDRVTVAGYEYLVPSDSSLPYFSSRSVLYAKCIVRNDTLHLFINHWPSRRGGVLAGEDQRRVIAEMIRNKVDSIASATARNAAIIIMGDFNSSPDDNLLSMLTSKYNSGLSMINLAGNIASGTGSYRYMGTWEMIDQIIVSDALIMGSGELATRQELFKIFRPSFLMTNDPVYPGLSPFSTYRGYRYQGGFSDHLPVLLDLRVR
jgi:predicted extracellular nuclease